MSKQPNNTSGKRQREWGENMDGRSPPLSPLMKPAPPPDQWRDYFPAVSGDIDLRKYDMPQDRAPLEWWYYNAHVTSKSTGGRFSVFSSFFRQADLTSIEREEYNKGKGYETFFTACTWALIDVENNGYYPDSLLDHRATDILVARLDTGRKLNHAEGPLLELAKKGRLPRPDRAMKAEGKLGKDSFSIDLDGECVAKVITPKTPLPAPAPQFAYHVHVRNPSRDMEADLIFQPEMQAVRHGTHGIVNEMFYYYIPRCVVSGTITVKGERHEVEGSGWYDREFGGSPDATGRDALDAWAWISIQLSDDSEFSLFNVVDRDTQHEKEKIAVWTRRDGTRVPATDVQITYKNLWTSLNTYIEYPQDWKVVVPSLGIDFHISAAFSHQEFMTILVTGGGFFEGRIHATGSRQGTAVTGTGFLERKNFTPYNDTAGLLKNVGRFVKKTLASMYPLDATPEWINKNVLGRHCTGKGVNPKQICDTLFRPVRFLTDRGGKSWRSLILVSAVNAVSRDYIDCSRYIAISELLHVGSLIIDDIQDESTVRRGGKTVHLEYGVPTAINAGTGCYFMAPLLGGVDDLPMEKAYKVYQLYFDVLRAGHAGQGLDIAGLVHLVPHAVETGEARELYDALQAIHVYKTGGAAGSICAVACILADATLEQADAVENFGTQIGLAFQIVDDALNLKGFEGDLKEVGEDIRDGKITYPVIKGLSRLPKIDREYIWAILQEKTEDQGKIMSVIAKLNSVGAIDDCLVEARNLVEEAWERLDPLLEDSLPKIMMRTFCSYLTERTF